MWKLVNFFQKTSFNNTQFGLARFTFIVSHVQLLIGFLSWFRMGFITHLQTNAKAIMSDATARLLAVEHPMVNIIGIVLISIGFLQMKKQTEDRPKHLKIIIFYGLAFILILSRIPWHLWVE